MVSRAAVHLCEPSAPSFLKRMEKIKQQRELKVTEWCGWRCCNGIGGVVTIERVCAWWYERWPRFWCVTAWVLLIFAILAFEWIAIAMTTHCRCCMISKAEEKRKEEELEQRVMNEVVWLIAYCPGTHLLFMLSLTHTILLTVTHILALTH